MPARILDAVSCLVGELAEIDFPRVRGKPQHEDVGAGTEDALATARDDDAANLGVLEAYALQRVRELDVDTEVVGVELELVAWQEAAILVDRERGDRDGPVAREVREAIDTGCRHR